MVYAVASAGSRRSSKGLGRTHSAVEQGRAPGGSSRTRSRRPTPTTTRNARLLFGYFEADRTDPGRNLPGQTVFTCLSHDIIAHETTHAVDRSGPTDSFIEPDESRRLAFHEASPTSSRSFMHFTLPDVVRRDKIQRHPGPSSRRSTLLAELAQRFGTTTGQGTALRTATRKVAPTRGVTRPEFEPHARGSILVAAIFDAFFTASTRARIARPHPHGDGWQRDPARPARPARPTSSIGCAEEAARRRGQRC